MIRLFLVLIALVSNSLAFNISNYTVWDSIALAGSKTLAKELNQWEHAAAIETALEQPNITFFLPSEAATTTALNNSVLNFTHINATVSQLLRHIVPETYTSQSLLQKHAYLTTVDPLTKSLPLVVGPQAGNQSNLQVASGIITANAIVKDTRCSNGIIHIIDQVLETPKDTMTTIEELPQLENHELVLRTLNLTSIVTGSNKTVLAPTNQAWIDANYTAMPYGTLVHDLKYQVIDGVYLRNALFPGNERSITLETTSRDRALTFRESPDNQLLVIGGSADDVAHVVQADVITTEGVIHIIDKVLSADTRDGDFNDGGGVLAGNPANPSGTSASNSPAGLGGITNGSARLFVTNIMYMSSIALWSII